MFLPLFFVNPRGTSTIGPRCRAKLSYNHRLAVCKSCGFIADRDEVGAVNIYLKALKHLAPRPGLWGTRSMTDETRPKSGLLIDEPMTLHIKT